MNEKLKQQIMGRIYAAYYVRRYGYSVLNGFIFVAASLALYISVSWKNVFANMPSLTNTSESYNFFTSAVMNTEMAVKLSLIAIAAVLISYAVHLVRKNNSQSLLKVRQNI